jgi:streptogramin lyase
MSRPVRAAASVALAASFVALAGCAPTPVAPAPTAWSEEVPIGLTEWAVAVGGVHPAPGDVAFVVTNTGATTHDLIVRGDLGTWATPVLDPGERYVLRIRTAAGETLDLVCSLVGHEAQGMHTTLRVGDADSADIG